MDDEKLRDVMMYRYIDGLKLEEIAIENERHSYMQIYRLHKEAISENHVIECYVWSVI